MLTLNCRGKLISLEQTLVMGIMNITPDSFYAASRTTDLSAVINKAAVMINDGADIIDIGGQSTRPGSNQIGADKEMNRVMPVIEILHKEFPDLIISIDTYHAAVAASAVHAGASIVNDISGGTLDDNMISVVASLSVPYICMHMRGTPENMQEHAHYKNVTLDVLDYFIEKSAICERAGIRDLIIDPGFGFAKTAQHNFELLRNLDKLKILQKPILAGLSRKSTIYKTLGVPIEESLNGTTVMNTLALTKGANILRVHDVKEAKQIVKLCNEVKGER
jgi:dihydropteroate synthase